MPIEGKSVGISDFQRDSDCFMAALDFSCARKRRRGSATFVASVTTVIEAWLFERSSPSWRSDTGTAATNALRGSASRPFR